VVRDDPARSEEKFPAVSRRRRGRDDPRPGSTLTFAATAERRMRRPAICVLLGSTEFDGR
jgi:hypothetical protein